MKKLYLLLAFLAGMPVFGHAYEIFQKHSEVFIPTTSFKDGTDVSYPVTYTATTVAYLALPTATNQQAVVFPSANQNCTITASFFTPNDMVPGVTGDGKLFALVHLAGTTGTAQLDVTTIESSEFGLLTSTASYVGMTYTSGAVARPIPSTAATQIRRYELPTITSTATTSLPFYPNRLVHVKIYNSASTNQAIEVYGLIFKYIRDPKLAR